MLYLHTLDFSPLTHKGGKALCLCQGLCVCRQALYYTHTTGGGHTRTHTQGLCFHTHSMAFAYRHTTLAQDRLWTYSYTTAGDTKKKIAELEASEVSERARERERERLVGDTKKKIAELEFSEVSERESLCVGYQGEDR